MGIPTYQELPLSLVCINGGMKIYNLNVFSKYFEKKEITHLPIMSLDSHDYNYCDFNCKDCLAVDTRQWAEKELGFKTFDIVITKDGVDKNIGNALIDKVVFN